MKNTRKINKINDSIRPSNQNWFHLAQILLASRSVDFLLVSFGTASLLTTTTTRQLQSSRDQPNIQIMCGAFFTQRKIKRGGKREREVHNKLDIICRKYEKNKNTERSGGCPRVCGPTKDCKSKGQRQHL